MRFNEIQSRNELADFLCIQRKTLTYVLFEAHVDSFYTAFEIPKKDGTSRHILAPSGTLKMIQQKLAAELWNYQSALWLEQGISPNLSHAFEKGKGVITNATIHRNKRFIVCFDIKSYFESFHFGRVAGFFQANRNFRLPREVAITIAQIACYDGHLPQGAPSSPIITNLICQILDIHLLKLAKKYKMDYTRYADDLTFSTNNKSFLECADQFIEELKTEIHSSGFTLNEAKSRIMYRDSRQIVTGLIVNHKINVPRHYYKETRAMLHSLYTTGVFTISAEKGTINQLEGRLSFIDHIEHYNNIHDSSGKRHDSHNLSAKEKEYRNFLFYKYFVANPKMVLLTEGKTDIRYIKAALKNLYRDYPKLITRGPDGKFQFHITFFNRTRHWNYFFGVPVDGADAMKTLYHSFCGNNTDNLCTYFSEFKTQFSSSPVVFLFDNEKNTSRPLRKFINSAKLNESQKDELSSRNHILLNSLCKLSLVSVPLAPGLDECELEDLFTADTLAVELNGRKFSRKDEDLHKFFNKDIFSKYVYHNYQSIDFSGFRPLLDILCELVG